MKRIINTTLATLLFIIPLTQKISGQTSRMISENEDSFREDIVLFMGVNLNDEQNEVLNRFLNVWDSIELRTTLRSRIFFISNQLSGRAMRPAPDFIQFMRTISTFASSEKGSAYFENWLTGLSEAVPDPLFSNNAISSYLETTENLMRNNTLYHSNSVQWKIGRGDFRFEKDSLFKIDIINADLVCFSQGDSTTIIETEGVFYSGTGEFHGKKGKITWEKAGYQANDVYAQLPPFSVNMTSNSIVSDSAMLYHSTYFSEPVRGKLTDQAYKAGAANRVTYPRFETDISEFEIKNLYEGTDFKGGLVFEGDAVRGKGEKYQPASISLFRNDTLYIVAESEDFMLLKNSVNSQDVAMTMYLEEDSVFHANLGFSFNTDTREVSFFRTSSPVSRSPYSNSFHDIDMHFESLQWNMNEPYVRMSRARGASIGNAQFESHSFFRRSVFERMIYFDDVHPLYNLRNFANYYYSNTFPIADYAKWLGKPYENVVSMCIELSNQGFIFFDRSVNEITLKSKVDDFISFFARQRDYDIISINSEVAAPNDNAVLDLRNYNLTIDGVSAVFLSDSQRVAIFPYNNRITMEEGRSFKFDGVVVAGLFTIFGHNFDFRYDDFTVNLHDIDSIKIAVQTDQLDARGNPIAEEVDNLIQLGSAELFIDNPNNKSGRRSLKQYPIISTTTDSYIFFDKIPGLEDIYGKEEFYFRVDPFTYENIDQYSIEDMHLAGVFSGSSVTGDIRHILTIQEDNSLGFSYSIPEDGLPVYDGKGQLFEHLSMSNKGLIGSGHISRLEGNTYSEEFMLFPDSMKTDATEFIIASGDNNLFPDLKSTDVEIKWMTDRDEWYAWNQPGKDFEMFMNDTRLDGFIVQSPDGMKGGGIVNRPDSRLVSDYLSFTSSVIEADSSDYQLKSLTGDGIAFLAENTSTVIDFPANETRFTLNTGASFVNFPEIEYICTMTDFVYSMDSQIMRMEQSGTEATKLLTAAELLDQSKDDLAPPTFFSTNSMQDTLKFNSLSGAYYLRDEYIEASGISYIPVADALIQPDEGTIIIGKRARIRDLGNATVAVNNRHILHSASINIESVRRYSGSGIYDYIDEEDNSTPINFGQIKVDTLRTSAKGFISKDENFMLSPFFTFTGDVELFSTNEFLTFNGGAGISHNCTSLSSETIKFKSEINPLAVMIPVDERQRDVNDNMVFSGSMLHSDSIHIYPAFLSPRKSWSDINLVAATGNLYYDKEDGIYIISDQSKIADRAMPGDMVTLDRNFCTLYSEGKVDFGANFDLFKMNNAGSVTHNTDSALITVKTFMALEFHFSGPALTLMADEIRLGSTLPAVSLTTDFYRKGMIDLLGEKAYQTIGEELGLFGTVRNMPQDYTYTMLLNDVTLSWNEMTSSFRSTGKIGIGFIGRQPVNMYVDGHIEIQRRRSGDLIDIYLKVDESTWYYFSYFRGVLMTISGNNAYNTIITDTRIRDRRHPDASTRVPYTYMISVEDRLRNFLRRMSQLDLEEDF